MMNEDGTWPDQSEMVYHMPYLEDMASRASVIIEIGCGHGNGSTRAFERGLMRAPEAKLFISVDDNPDKPDVKPMLACWHKVTGDSRSTETRSAVDALLKFPVDLFYIDTEHTYDHLEAELANWIPLASPQTIWLFHDVFMWGNHNRMTDAITDFCVAHPEWEYVLITEESHGMGMMRWKIHE